MSANSEGSGEFARMRRLAWAFGGRLSDKYHNLMRRLTYIPWNLFFNYYLAMGLVEVNDNEFYCIQLTKNKSMIIRDRL